MDYIIKNVRLTTDAAESSKDIAVKDGKVAAIAPGLTSDNILYDAANRLAIPGFVESHIHLDKACILDRCTTEEGTLEEAIREVSKAKRAFTVEDIQSRAIETLEQCIKQGTTRMRAHLEVDPVIGSKSIEAILPLIEQYRWAIDLEICVFPQEGMLNNPGTEALMIDALKRGAKVIGGCPYTDDDPYAQIDRVFALASEFDVDIDFHLDFDTNPEGMTVDRVCDNAEKHNWQGRVTIGHVSKLSALPPNDLDRIAQRMSDAGVALTVLPATDLFLMGGPEEHNVVRGVAPVHRMAARGVTCALSTNNVLNPFTPFGDCSMIRIANLYVNIARIGTKSGHRESLEWITEAPAKLMGLDDYGIAVGNPADFVILDANSAERAVQTVAPPLRVFKNGKQTVTHDAAILHRPSTSAG